MPAAHAGDDDTVLVTLSVDPARFAEVAGAARQTGLAVDHEQPALGTLAGRLQSRFLPALRAIDGVQHVELDRTIQLPPPGSDLQ